MAGEGLFTLNYWETLSIETLPQRTEAVHRPIYGDATFPLACSAVLPFGQLRATNLDSIRHWHQHQDPEHCKNAHSSRILSINNVSAPPSPRYVSFSLFCPLGTMLLAFDVVGLGCDD
jgi:hypothetical protein